MYKIITLTALLLTSFYAHSSVVLNSGESFSSSFGLVSDGNSFKLTDAFWEIIVDSEVPLSTSTELTLTVFEDTNFTSQVGLFSDTIQSSGARLIGVGNVFLFEDFDGSFTLQNTGVSEITINEVLIANFAGTETPSFAAFDTVTPTTVPLPTAGWLLLSTLGVLGAIRRKQQ